MNVNGILLTAVLSLPSAPADVDRGELIRLIESAKSDLTDFAFEYEGHVFLPREKERASQGLGPDGISATYAGTFARRADGATLSERFDSDRRSRQVRHSRTARLGETVQTSSDQADGSKPEVKVRRATSSASLGRGSYGQLLLREVALDYARSRLLFEDLGTRDLDGHECLVVRFYHSEDESADRDRLISYTFWLDLGRGANVLRFEKRWPGEKLAELTKEIQLREFLAPSGRSAWLPISGRSQGHISIDPKVRPPIEPIHTAEDDPVYVETYNLLTESIRLEQGLKDGDFSVKTEPRGFLTDELRRASSEYDQFLVEAATARSAESPSRAEVERDVDRMLDDPDVLARELRASSPGRDGPRLLSWLPWMVAGGGAVALAIVLARRHMGG